MKIDRSNYEVWLIDWLDGKLDEVQTQRLQSFLKKNSDLREEYEDLGIIRLSPREEAFAYKNHIKKTTDNLTESQFEYLCAAYLENDLLPDQINELNEAVSNPGRSRSFELIQRMKLVPPVVHYKKKHRLIKTTLTAKIIRLTVAGLSAAAMVAIGLFIFNPVPTDYSGSAKMAQEIKTENPVAREEATTIDINASTVPDNKRGGTSETPAGVSESLSEGQFAEDPQVEKPVITINKIRVSSNINMKTEAPATLIAMNNTDIITIPDDGRSKVSRLIAKTFREKILNEPTPQDKPLKAVEIAEAGVTGLNKILGWEMALGEKSSIEGKTHKIYFNSRILKINAPANKTEPEL